MYSKVLRDNNSQVFDGSHPLYHNPADVEMRVEKLSLSAKVHHQLLSFANVQFGDKCSDLMMTYPSFLSDSVSHNFFKI